MKPTIGRIVQYVNLGDKDGKYPPEVQAALVTGVYYVDPFIEGEEPQMGNNDPKKLGLNAANKLGDKPDSTHADLLVFYRTGSFNMVCVPFSEEPKRGHWTWPPRG